MVSSFTRIMVAVFLLTLVLPEARPAAADHHIQRFVRFQDGETTAYGLVEDDRVRRLEGDLFGDWQKTDETLPLDQVKILVPTQPSKVLGAAMNYQNPDAEAQPQKPEFFLKTPTCLIADGKPIVIPKGSENVVYESELVIVIGKRASNVSVEEAGDYIFGVTCGNDVTAADFNEADLQFWRGKGSDTFGPCGPYIVTGVDYSDLKMDLRLNGEVVQTGQTGKLIFSPEQLVSFASQYMTLEPGDLIYTGAAGAPGPAKAGDRVQVEIENVGTLANPVKAEQ